MADLQITQLPELGSAQLQATDPIALADVSAAETKKITAKNFVQGAFALVDNSTVPATKLQYPLTAGQIVTATLADNAVTNVKITDATITGAKLADDTITATQIANNAIGSNELGNESVHTGAIINSNVTTLKIADSAITTAKIADSAITNAKIANSTISFAKTNFSDGDIAGTKITDASINGVKLINNTITATQIGANAITSSELADNSVDTAAIVNLAVTTAKIADSAVTFAKTNFSDGDIPGAKLTSASITSTQLATNSVSSSELADNAVDTSAIVNAAVTGAKIAVDTITASNIAANAVGSSELADNAVDTNSITDLNVTTGKLANLAVSTDKIAATAVTTAKIADSSVTFAKTNFTDGDIPGAKITGDSITASQLANNSVTANELADNAVDTAAIVNSAVTSAKIATDTITANNIAADAIGASELADNAVDSASIATNAVITTKITDLNVTTDKLAANAVTAAKIANDTITATQIAANAITASELANSAVDTASILDTAVTDAKISAVSGTKITDGTITPDKLNASNLDRSLNVASGNLGINNAVTGGASARSGITYNNEGLITSTAALVASDLPEATTTAIGAVSVPTAGGLAVSGIGELSIDNTITAATISGITFNEQGLITATTALTAGDLPEATASAIGAVSIPASSAPLAISGTGVLSIADSGVTAGTYTKVTVTDQGFVTDGATLVEADIPDLAATKITTGEFGTNFLANDSITMDKLANLSTGFIQEGSPDISNLPTGVFWLQESTGQLRIFNGNSFFSVGFGRLAEENLRFCGTFNASNGTIVTLTAFGTSAGFTVSNAIPAGTSTLTGAYFVCVTAGNGTAVVPSTSFDAGDWCLCVGPDNWDRIDTLSGPGSVSSLNDLSDVTLSSPTTGQLLVLQAAGQFANVSVISGGTY